MIVKRQRLGLVGSFVAAFRVENGKWQCEHKK